MQDNKGFSMIADIDGEYMDLSRFNIPDEIGILAVRNIVMFPGVVSPILIGRNTSMQLVQHAEKHNELIGVICQRKPDIESPMLGDLYKYGVLARIIRQITLPNGNVTAIIQALGRIKLDKLTNLKPYLKGKVMQAEEIEPDKNDREFRTAMNDMRQTAHE